MAGEECEASGGAVVRWWEGLLRRSICPIVRGMVQSSGPVTFQPEQVAELSRQLSAMRHNINNHLSLIMAAGELARRKPEMAGRMADVLAEPPKKIVEEIQNFSAAFEKAFGLKRA